jgi:hypothetical protein
VQSPDSVPSLKSLLRSRSIYLISDAACCMSIGVSHPQLFAFGLPALGVIAIAGRTLFSGVIATADHVRYQRLFR